MEYSSVGFWGNRTSTIDWCEKNYEITYYIAEFWNTVTNLMMIILPLYGIREVYHQRFDKKFIFSHLSLLAVGFGSWAFHMTLLYSMQLMDELPMVWGVSFLFFSLYESHVHRRINKSVNMRPTKLAIIAFAVLFTILYLIWPLPLFHNLVYGILAVSSFYLEVQLIVDTGCKICKKLCVLSFFTSIFAFFLWNIDRHFCANLTNFREALPYVAQPLTQFHGWWHLFVGYSVYLQILLCIHGYYDTNKITSKKLIVTDYYITIKWSEDKVT